MDTEETHEDATPDRSAPEVMQAIIHARKWVKVLLDGSNKLSEESITKSFAAAGIDRAMLLRILDDGTRDDCGFRELYLDAASDAGMSNEDAATAWETYTKEAAL